MPECLSLRTGLSAPTPEATVLCLGNFDGVHLGHRALFERAITLKKERFPEAALGVFCFREQSSNFLFPEPPGHICTLEERLEQFAACGMEYVFLADFPSMRNMPPEIFATKMLRDTCHASALVCGFNYRFGAGGIGTPELLTHTLGMPIAVCPEVQYRGETVSSTRVRRLLSLGEVETAAKLLTRPFSFSAPVLHGKALGRRLGSPTINQVFPEKLQIPRFGVYVTECRIDGECYRGVTNVGTRPSVKDGGEINCETYLLDFDRDIYGERVQTAFLHFLRPELQFSGLDDLRAQIQSDIEAARAY